MVCNLCGDMFNITKEIIIHGNGDFDDVEKVNVDFGCFLIIIKLMKRTGSFWMIINENSYFKDTDLNASDFWRLLEGN